MERTEEKTTGEQPTAPAKRPYVAPRLRRLGSVRDLTLGSQGANADIGFSKKGNKGM
jgi:hypothetical protein